MQHRMKQNPLAYERIQEILGTEEVGRFVTINHDGYPYAVPVHFVYYNDQLYFHGLAKGQKLDNIEANSKVCFEVDKMHGYLKEGADMPCNVNTDYESIVITGDAKIVDDFALKEQVLQKIVEKYIPEMKHMQIPEKMILGTAVVEIAINDCTGKYYNQASLSRENG